MKRLTVCYVTMLLFVLPVAAQEKRQKHASFFRLVTPQPKPSLDATYEDRFVLIEFSILKQLAFTLTNKTGLPIEINWDRASYVDIGGKAHRVMHTGVRYSERDKPQAPTVIPSGASIEDIAHPVDYIRLVELEWTMDDLFRLEDLFGDNSPFKSKPIQLLLPVKIGNTWKNYQFVFRLRN